MTQLPCRWCAKEITHDGLQWRHTVGTVTCITRSDLLVDWATGTVAEPTPGAVTRFLERDKVLNEGYLREFTDYFDRT